MKASEISDGMTVLIENDVVENVSVTPLGESVKVEGWSLTCDRKSVYFLLTTKEVDQWEQQ